METNTPNLSTDFVQNMLAESPAKEQKELVVADRIIKQSGFEAQDTIDIKQLI